MTPLFLPLRSLALGVALLGAGTLMAQERSEVQLRQWDFRLEGQAWQAVRTPHDWAISGPFDENIDLQFSPIEQNGETTESRHSGRSGALPWIGNGEYRTTFQLPKVKGRVWLTFDGAMAEPVVYVNGHEAGSWPYGYNAFRTPDGHAYGFTVGGKIYIDPRIAKADTPIHEYTHLWAAAVRQCDAKAWADIVRLMQGTPLWDEVAQHYPELADDVDALAEEGLSHYSGRRGAERLREAQRAAMEQEGLDAQAAAVSAVERVRQALKRFWRKVADFFGRRFTTAEEVADTVLSDMLNGVKPAFDAKDGGVRYDANSEEAGIVARAKADGTYMKAPNGQPSKLTPRQWVQVRTKAFKEWFGDWEKAARVEMIQGLSAIGINPHSLSKDELHDLYRTFKPVQKDGHSIAFYNGAFKKIYKEGVLFAKIVPQLRDVFEQSLFAYEEADSLGGTVRKDGTVHKEHKNIVHYQNYVGKVDILGHTYYVRFTVQEEQSGLMGTHSFFVSNVDVYDNPTENRTIPITSRGTTDFDGIADAKLKKFFFFF